VPGWIQKTRQAKLRAVLRSWLAAVRDEIESRKQGKLKNNLMLTTNQFLTDVIIVLTSGRLITGASVSPAASYLNGTAAI
jgi:hypothetical protein